jgi:signal transduction histidine kinase
VAHANADEQPAVAVARLQDEVAELRGSRRRLAEAAGADRRAIERAIHDGVQQDLVALAVNLRRVAALVDRDPAAARALLDEMTADVRQALADAAELAHRIYPSILETRGLATALRSAADRAGVVALIDVAADARYPPEMYALVYQCWVDALSSVPAASEATITVRDADGSLGFEVGIVGHLADGRLDGVRDRIEALGGEVSVVGAEAGRLHVQGVLPVSR